MGGFRLQGTDGIRATTSLGAAHPGITPQDAFLKHNIITEEFMELYVYCFCKMVAGDDGRSGHGSNEIVIGWDPRDTEGLHTGAAVRGARRAGFTAVVIGVASTPSIAMYMVWRGAPAAVVISASHNFRTQNGIKLFRGAGVKMFPEDDVVLTNVIMATSYAHVRTLPPLGEQVNAAVEARAVFKDFHVRPVNSWVGAAGGSKARLELEGPVIVDPANGALTGVAADVIRSVVAPGCEVIEVNNDAASGDVNTHGGVGDLEDVEVIARDDIAFKTHRSVQEVLARRGGFGVVFDADGDRFYGLVYDAARDAVLVLSGDEAAIHLAQYQQRAHRGRGVGSRFVYTVESDLEAGRKAVMLGCKPTLTGVGDKWLLRQAFADAGDFLVACEASGHSITRGRLVRRDGVEVDFFAGNGLKAAVNCLVATAGLPAAAVAAPFEKGHKKGFTVFYTNKALLKRGAPLLDALEKVAAAELAKLGEVKREAFADEPDMLYMAVYEGGAQRAGVFIRNSGTEEKTGINVRGRVGDAAFLNTLGQALSLELFEAMKNPAHPMARAERAVLAALAAAGAPVAEPTVPEGVHKERLMKEMVKGGLLSRTADGYAVSAHGRRCLAVGAKGRL